MKISTIACSVLVSFVLTACGGGGSKSDSNEEKIVESFGNTLTLSGMVIWDKPVVGVDVEVFCNNTLATQVGTTNGRGEFSITVNPTKSFKGPYQKCMLRSFWGGEFNWQNKDFKAVESYVTNFSEATSLNVNLNAASSIWSWFNSRGFYVFTELVQDNAQLVWDGYIEFEAGDIRQPLRPLPFMRTNYPFIFPDSFDEDPVKYSPMTHFFGIDNKYYNDIVKLAKDLDYFELNAYKLSTTSSGLFPTFTKEINKIDSDGFFNISFNDANVDPIRKYHDGILLTQRDRSRFNVTLKYENGETHSEGVVTINLDTSKPKEKILKLKASDFNVANLAPGTRLKVYIYGVVYGSGVIEI